MFRKAAAIKVRVAVGGKDKKEFRRKVGSEFSLSEEEVDAVVPSDMELAKASESPNVFYFGVLDASSPSIKDPAWFSVDGRFEVVPTVYTLWARPTLLPCVFVHSLVSKYVINGADLMIPGVAVSTTFTRNFKQGDLVSICVHGNRYPIAVGVVTMTDEELIRASQNQNKGKAVEVMHSFFDELWQSGSRRTPDESFTAKLVKEELDFIENTKQQEEEDTTVVAAEQQGVANHSDNKTTEEDGLDQNLVFPIGVMDLYLDACLLEVLGGDTSAVQTPIDGSALLTRMKSVASIKAVSTLPILLNAVESAFGSDMAKRLARYPPVLDLKRSTHKKFPKFLASAVKDGLLSSKDRRGIIVITAVNFSHPRIVDFVKQPERLRRVEQSIIRNKKAAVAESSSGSGAIKVMEYYKASQRARRIFEAMGAEMSKATFYSLSQSHKILNDYIATKKLVDTANGEVNLDYDLAHALKCKSHSTSTPVSMSRPEVVRHFTNNLDGYFSIIKPNVDPNVDPPKMKKGPIKSVILYERDRMGGRKHTTHIQHLEEFLVDEKAVAELLSGRLACSTSIDVLPGQVASAGKIVSVQGSVSKEVKEVLEVEFGIPRKHVIIGNSSH